eukprot:COSAG02_NODE_151_length_33583_cov_25.995042_8_plen_143_part_00
MPVPIDQLRQQISAAGRRWLGSTCRRLEAHWGLSPNTLLVPSCSRHYSHPTGPRHTHTYSRALSGWVGYSYRWYTVLVAITIAITIVTIHYKYLRLYRGRARACAACMHAPGQWTQPWGGPTGWWYSHMSDPGGGRQDRNWR